MVRSPPHGGIMAAIESSVKYCISSSARCFALLCDCRKQAPSITVKPLAVKPLSTKSKRS